MRTSEPGSKLEKFQCFAESLPSVPFNYLGFIQCLCIDVGHFETRSLSYAGIYCFLPVTFADARPYNIHTSSNGFAH